MSLMSTAALAAALIAGAATLQPTSSATATFSAAAMRGDTLHRQEESRFQLSVERNNTRALELAVANWAIQREPYDARILLEAAVAAGRRDAAQPVLDWLAQSRHEDPQLAVLAQKLVGGKP